MTEKIEMSHVCGRYQIKGFQFFKYEGMNLYVLEHDGAGIANFNGAFEKEVQQECQYHLDEHPDHGGKKNIVPINECCAKCNYWKDKFGSTGYCQEYQKAEALRLGITDVICPNQYPDKYNELY